MEDRLQQIKNQFSSDIAATKSLTDLENVRIKYLGRKAELMTILASIATLSPEDKRVIGKEGNLMKREIETAITSKLKELKNTSSVELKQVVDITEPSKKNYVGKSHIISQVIDEVIEVFGQFGFEY